MTMKGRKKMVRNFALYRTALALKLVPRPELPTRQILRRRSRFKPRPCQCCGKIFQPLGRWNCRCEVCRTLQDEDGVPPRVFSDPHPSRENTDPLRESRSSA
jgi:hypothetical protein